MATVLYYLTVAGLVAPRRREAVCRLRRSFHPVYDSAVRDPLHEGHAQTHLGAFAGIFSFLAGSSSSNAVSGLMEGVCGDKDEGPAWFR
jgi:hypothetical protein